MRLPHPFPKTCLLVLLLGATTVCLSAPAAAPAAASSTSAREAATRTRLAEVRGEIAKIADAQRATATKRDAINAKLASQAAQLNQAANALRESDTAIAAKAASLADLEKLRAVYTLNRGTDLAMLLGDDDIAKIDRALVSSRYFQRDRVARIRALLGEVSQLDNVKASIETETVALEQQRDQRAVQATELEQARDAQQKLLAQADARLAQQKDKLASLQHDA